VGGLRISLQRARLELTYQYSNLVCGPWAQTRAERRCGRRPLRDGLAAMIDPEAAAQNFIRLTEAGASGRYGLYEALDYTATRVLRTSAAVVRAYMAHHQGMSLVALANVLREGVMRRRFHAEPRMQATELLLQERTPRDVLVARPRVRRCGGSPRPRSRSTSSSSLHFPTRRDSGHPPPLQRAIHGNGHDAGSGYSHWRDLAVHDGARTTPAMPGDLRFSS